LISVDAPLRRSSQVTNGHAFGASQLIEIDRAGVVGITATLKLHRASLSGHNQPMRQQGWRQSLSNAAGSAGFDQKPFGEQMV
jgi:hypothetical protein